MAKGANYSVTESSLSSVPLNDRLHEQWRIVRWYSLQMWQQFIDRDCLSAAGSLTYTTLFAVVPLMTVTYTMFSLMPEYAHVGEEVEAFIFQNFVPGSSSVVQEKLAEFADRARGLTTVGLVILFVTAFMMLVTIEKSFNKIWHVAKPRKGLQRFLLYWGVLSLGPACVVAGLLSSAYLYGLPLVSDLDAFGIRETLLGYLPVILSVLVFSVLYYAVPNCHVPFKHALLGGAVTTVVFQVALTVFAQASKGFSYDAIYGTFAAVPVFLFWLYLVWVIILCGAIFVRSIALSREDDTTAEPLVVKAARILQLFHLAHVDGRPVSDKEINDAVLLSQTNHDKVFGVFAKFNLLQQTEDERWVLGRNLKSVTLWDLYKQLPDGLELARLQDIDDMPGVVEPLIAITQFGSNEMSVSLDTLFNSSTSYTTN